jgi:acyl carrier protein
VIDRAEIKRSMAAFLKLPEERLGDDAVLSTLVQESFVLIQLVMELQEQFGARLVQEDLRSVKTVGDLITQFATRSVNLR